MQGQGFVFSGTPLSPPHYSDDILLMFYFCVLFCFVLFCFNLFYIILLCFISRRFVFFFLFVFVLVLIFVFV